MNVNSRVVANGSSGLTCDHLRKTVDLEMRPGQRRSRYYLTSYVWRRFDFVTLDVILQRCLVPCTDNIFRRSLSLFFFQTWPSLKSSRVLLSQSCGVWWTATVGEFDIGDCNESAEPKHCVDVINMCALLDWLTDIAHNDALTVAASDMLCACRLLSCQN